MMGPRSSTPRLALPPRTSSHRAPARPRAPRKQPLQGGSITAKRRERRPPITATMRRCGRTRRPVHRSHAQAVEVQKVPCRSQDVRRRSTASQPADSRCQGRRGCCARRTVTLMSRCKPLHLLPGNALCQAVRRTDATGGDRTGVLQDLHPNRQGCVPGSVASGEAPQLPGKPRKPPSPVAIDDPAQILIPAPHQGAFRALRMGSPLGTHARGLPRLAQARFINLCGAGERRRRPGAAPHLAGKVRELDERRQSLRYPLIPSRPCRQLWLLRNGRHLARLTRRPASLL